MAKITNIPAPNATRVVDFPRLDGGLNLWELDYRLKDNQSPEMKNLWWLDGVLQCRDGQEYVYGPTSAEDKTWESPGTGYCCAPSLFWDHAFFHIGSGLYYLNPAAESPVMKRLVDGIPQNRGTFFLYDRWLYYKNRGGFYRIAYESGSFSVSNCAADAHTPVIMLNTDPRTGAGDMYQPENRLSSLKTVRYTAVEGVTEYKLPVSMISTVESVFVDGAELSSADYEVNVEDGIVSFRVAPPVHDPVVNNTVEITYSKTNDAAMDSIMSCPYAAVYGVDNASVIVLGGSEAQGNAFFWNGNDEYGMSDNYWPMTNYQLAGDAEDSITGFGVQHGNLIVLKSRSVGKSTYSIASVDDRDTISLTYTEINNRIGCDLPWTTSLIENNLVFCNTIGGVHIVRDSSAALENNIECISKNVNGAPARPGLLYDVREARGNVTCGYDDDSRYWVCANGHAYLWDYTLSSWNDPSWFYLENIPGISFFRANDTSYHLDGVGHVSKFSRIFRDFNDTPIEKVYQFPTQYFGTYDRLKDVTSVLFSVRGDTNTEMEITYTSDYEVRKDADLIRSYTWRLVPRNLAFRYLGIRRFATVCRRYPCCRHIRHFSMRLENCVLDMDMTVISAQIFYKYQGRER